MSEPIRISFDLTPEYFAESIEKALNSRMRRIGAAVVVALTVGAVAYVVHGMARFIPAPPGVPLGLTISIEALVAGLLASFALGNRSFQKTMVVSLGRQQASMHHGKGQFSVEWTFGEDGVTKSLQDEVRSYEWKQVKRVEQLPGAFRIFLPQCFEWIPASAASSADDWAMLLKLVERKTLDFRPLSPEDAASEEKSRPRVPA